jgi:penicillin amidase
MKLLVIVLLCLSSLVTLSQTTVEIDITGLQQPVEVLRDANGVNHIYAKNEHDLFFAQGYCAAQDRLFQFEIWRRQATGTVAEILGPREIQRDIGARLFKFRGDLKREFNHYHARGETIIQAFTDGINAYIGETEMNPKLLPLEFTLLGIKPGYWKPENVISRHQGLLSNLTEEINIGRAVLLMGEERVKELSNFEPGVPDLSIDPLVRKSKLPDGVIAPYEAFRKTLAFAPQDLKLSANTNWKEFRNLAVADEAALNEFFETEKKSIGSNNWIVHGSKSKSGYPLLANDPHRAITTPSLRYMVHLNAPGWNVVGGGEPTIPGVSIGHNEFGAWGLTVFNLDAEDLYVYEINPANPKQYLYKGNWEMMRSVADTIRVKGTPDVYVEHLYTRHGPVTHVDKENNIAYAVRCGWLEIGSAPYLASLRIDQAANVDEFRNACTYSYLPGENMIWADRKGNISWQAVGIAPIRKNWSGLVPVPGDSRFEWDGYLPIKELPNVTNPPEGFVATANENNVPENYKNRNAVGWSWADRYRVNRINEVLSTPRKFSLDDMMALQFDYLSLPAKQLIPMLQNLKSTDAMAERARICLLNAQRYPLLHKDSISAAIYVAWEKKLSSTMLPLLVPEEVRKSIRGLYLSDVIKWLQSPDQKLGGPEGRNQFLIKCLEDAVKELTLKLGPDMKRWQYGQPAYHHVLIRHPLSNAVDAETRKKLEAGPLPRGGYGSTPGMTTNSENQLAGASFRIAIDTKDWDSAKFTNAPGQSGDPNSPFYKNLFEGWANDKHFTVYFSKKKVLQSTVQRVVLKIKNP